MGVGRVSLLAGLAALAACPTQPTTVLLHIKAEDGVGPLDELRISVFVKGEGVAVDNNRLPNPTLPSSIVLYPRQSSGRLWVLARGEASAKRVAEGATPVDLEPEQQVEATVMLSTTLLPDGDGDGVPDSIDNCPQIPNPDQRPCELDGGPPDGSADGPMMDGPPAPDVVRPDFPIVDCQNDVDCDDKDACTTETCAAGKCEFNVVKCPATSNPCKQAACDAMKGCLQADKLDGTKCDDGKYCTVNDACKAGACAGAARDCTKGVPVCQVGSCDESNGKCTTTHAAQGTKCDDKDTCTQGDVCDGAGKCVDPGPAIEVLLQGFDVEVGTDRTIVVDSNDRIHLVAYGGPGELRYGTNASGSWAFSKVVGGPSKSARVGAFPALAIDGNDTLHLVYLDGAASAMKYASRVKGATGWTTKTIGPGDGYSSIVAAGGDVHVSYMNEKELWYASGPGSFSAAKIEELPATSSYDAAGVDSSIALDTKGKVHIAHSWGEHVASFDLFAGRKLRHNTNASGSWAGDDAAPSLTKPHGNQASIAIDGKDSIFISHYGGTGPHELHLSSGQPGAWSTQSLATGTIGSFSSILINSKHHVHVSHRNFGPGELRHITDATGSWQLTVLDTQGQTGRWSSMAQDSSGRLHIVYENDTVHELKHATLSACP